MADAWCTWGLSWFVIKYLAPCEGKKQMDYTSFGAAVSEVEIDVLTGDRRILRTDIHFDCGQSLNPMVDMGQVIIYLSLHILCPSKLIPLHPPSPRGAVLRQTDNALQVFRSESSPSNPANVIFLCIPPELHEATCSDSALTSKTS